MTFFHPIEKLFRPSWNGYTLVLPAICVGNVGQLAVDLVISSLGMEKVGFIFDESITPVIGNDPYSQSISEGVGTMDLKAASQNNLSPSSSLTTSCEVFESKSQRLVTVQLRSPLIRGRRTTFCQNVIEFIKQHPFSKVILLTSSHAHERMDSQISGDQLRFVASGEFKKIDTYLHLKEQLKWSELEKRDNLHEPNVNVNPYIPGGGIAKQLLRCCDKEDVSLAVMMIFCSEGDNVPEAIFLANRLNDWLNLIPVGEDNGSHRKSIWRIPGSWSALFGNRPPEAGLVFG